MVFLESLAWEIAMNEAKNFSTSAPQMVSSLPTLASSKAKYLENGLGSPQMEPTTTKLTTSLLIGK